MTLRRAAESPLRHEPSRAIDGCVKRTTISPSVSEQRAGDRRPRRSRPEGGESRAGVPGLPCDEQRLEQLEQPAVAPVKSGQALSNTPPRDAGDGSRRVGDAEDQRDAAARPALVDGGARAPTCETPCVSTLSARHATARTREPRASSASSVHVAHQPDPSAEQARTRRRRRPRGRRSRCEISRHELEQTLEQLRRERLRAVDLAASPTKQRRSRSAYAVPSPKIRRNANRHKSRVPDPEATFLTRRIAMRKLVLAFWASCS